VTEVLNPQTYPVSFDIRAPRQPQQQPAPRPHSTDRIAARLDELEHRVDVLTGRLDTLVQHLLPKDPT